MISSKPDRTGVAGRIGALAAHSSPTAWSIRWRKSCPRRTRPVAVRPPGRCVRRQLQVPVSLAPNPSARYSRGLGDQRSERIELSRQRGFSRVPKRRVQGDLVVACAAAFSFVCHGPGRRQPGLSGGALVVNLWHGVGLKSLRLGNPKSPTVLSWRDHRPAGSPHAPPRARLTPDILVTTSEFTQRHFSSQFGLPADGARSSAIRRLTIRMPILARALRQVPGSEPSALWRDG